MELGDKVWPRSGYRHWSQYGPWTVLDVQNGHALIETEELMPEPGRYVKLNSPLRAWIALEGIEVQR